MLTTTKVVSSNPVPGEVYSIQHYVIKFVSYLRQVGGFLRFSSPKKLRSRHNYHRSSSLSHSWQDVLDTTLCDKVCK